MVTGSGEKRFHDQISWLMFLFSIFVIWVHSYNVDLFSGGARDGIWSLADRIENFVSVGLGQIAVPGFFLLSSYLFFRNFSWDKLVGKWKSRVFSVLIPYVVWNLIYYLGYMAASRFSPYDPWSDVTSFHFPCRRSGGRSHSMRMRQSSGIFIS